MKKTKMAKKKTEKPQKNRKDLKTLLQSIYHGNINLQTTCNHNGICCKTACPQMNYSEFVQIITSIWNSQPKNDIVEMICTSLEYFFRYEYAKWGKDSLIKPCMLLNEEGLCSIYGDRPLNCRLYGLWPESDYENRVQKFVKAYETYGLKKEDIPLSSQCPFVKRIDESKELTTEVIDDLFSKLDNIDKSIGGYTDAQVRQRENYRTFHDWLLLKILGEDFLSSLTTFVLAADRSTMEDQIVLLKKTIRENFIGNLPDITKTI